MNLHAILIIASLIEKEAKIPLERPYISSVFNNRLRLGMRLDCDPTVRYALKKFSGPLTRDDLDCDSPYNTYMNPGLPPGPISNPGLPALKAVAYPAKTPYFYFRAACDQSGRHNFSKTFDEHVQNGCN